MTTPPPRSTLFPYTTLFRSQRRGQGRQDRPRRVQQRRRVRADGVDAEGRAVWIRRPRAATLEPDADFLVHRLEELHADRKSTRLNSSHRCISYAVFCLKKKK